MLITNHDKGCSHILIIKGEGEGAGRGGWAQDSK